MQVLFKGHSFLVVKLPVGLIYAGVLLIIFILCLFYYLCRVRSATVGYFTALLLNILWRVGDKRKCLHVRVMNIFSTLVFTFFLVRWVEPYISFCLSYFGCDVYVCVAKNQLLMLFYNCFGFVKDVFLWNKFQITCGYLTVGFAC